MSARQAFLMREAIFQTTGVSVAIKLRECISPFSSLLTDLCSGSATSPIAEQVLLLCLLYSEMSS